MGGREARADSLVNRLIERSLAERGDDGRVRMLETVREYAREQLGLDAAAADLTRGRFLGWAIDVASRAGDAIHGPEERDALEGLEVDHDNLRSALDWAIEAGRTEAAMTLATVMSEFWIVRGDIAEGQSRWSRVLSMPAATEGTTDPAVRARGLLAAGMIFGSVAGLERGVELSKEAMSLYQSIGDVAGEAEAKLSLGFFLVRHGQPAAAEEVLRESLELSRVVGNRRGVAIALDRIAGILGDREQYDEAAVMIREAGAIYEEVGDLRSLAWTHGTLGQVCALAGRPEKAAGHYREMLRIGHELRYHLAEAWGRCGLGQLALSEGDRRSAREHFEQALNIHRRIGSGQIVWPLSGLAQVAMDEGDLTLARSCLAERAQLDLQVDGGSLFWALWHFVPLLAAEGRPREAAAFVGAIASVVEREGETPTVDADRALFDAVVERCRAELGPAFDEARRWGASCSPAQLLKRTIAEEPPGRAWDELVVAEA
jgi:tetratricopeptide (TPR) repeat protein